MKSGLLSRRTFVGSAAATAAFTPTLFAQTGVARREFKFAVVGCGGRGSGAVANIIAAATRMGCKATLVAAADHRLEKAQAVCKRYGCNEQFAFGGPTGYQKVMESPAEIVLLAAPPFFRPLHLEACVKAGKHIFAEKPVATDPAGLRRFLAGVEAAKKANLSILSGTCHRHNNKALRMIKPMQEGAIGPIRGGVVYRCHAGMNSVGYMQPRKPGASNIDYLSTAWYFWRQMSGDNLTEQGIHEVDLANWFIGRLPKTALGIGARHRRAIGNGYDCLSVDYDYGDGLHIHAIARQVDGCSDRLGTLLTGTEGECAVLGKITRFDGKPVAYDEERVKSRDENMMTMEHWDFLNGLDTGNFLHEGEQVAMATATTLLGTLACYTGQTVRMSDLLTNDKSAFYTMNNPFLPEDFEKGDVELPKEFEAPVPGK
jgi:myo-inositol 2-dehydrogenase / D-chiro-inositol 1-dehydrogenase